MPLQLQGKSILVRQTLPEDAPLLFRAYQDKAFLSAYSSNLQVPESEAQLRQILQQRLEYSPAQLHFAECLILHKKHGAIGIASLSDYSTMHHRAEYLIGLFSQEHRNAGYGLEATLLMMELAFNHFRLNKIYTYTYEDNPLSRKMTQNFGFQQEGILHNHHYSYQTQTYLTLYHFGLSQEDFRQNRNMARWARKLLARDITEAPSTPPPSAPPQQMTGPSNFEFLASPQFNAWLAEQRVSLAFTSNQTGKLFLVGLQPNGRLSIFERTFNRCMGLHATADTLYMSTLYQLWRFDNALQMGQIYQGYDRLYVPQLAYTTGDLEIHDINIDAQGKPVFINTLFSCLATVSEQHSFQALWQPPFISKLVAEDRCHLNGLALQDGQPRYVTSVSQSDVADGWRENRQAGGTVIDVQTNEIMLSGLSMPHSPRYYQGKLWLLNSGTGELGYLESDHFEPVTFCPGYLRGLRFVGHFAIVGLSKPRLSKTFSELKLNETLKEKQTHCGLQIIDLRTGECVHWLRISGRVEELYDLAVLPGVQRPMALGLKTDEIQRLITIAP
ncbi:MAG: TIGR03032 family protein [Candidatus Parabeggiatoa sp.]|nr:TIGR03032 family protein [Candidatus Parabeggiatoa sp.]